MVSDFLNRAREFALRYRVEIGSELGSGTQGAVFDIIDNGKGGPAAVKVHFQAHSFVSECAAYQRLRELGIYEVCGFNVPKLLRVDEDLLAIEMSIVRRPYVLDFGGAVIDEEPPEFPDEVWTDWEREKLGQYGDRWPIVQNVITEFGRFGIHLLDISPSNIAFRD